MILIEYIEMEVFRTVNLPEHLRMRVFLPALYHNKHEIYRMYDIYFSEITSSWRYNPELDNLILSIRNFVSHFICDLQTS